MTFAQEEFTGVTNATHKLAAKPLHRVTFNTILFEVILSVCSFFLFKQEKITPLSQLFQNMLVVSLCHFYWPLSRNRRKQTRTTSSRTRSYVLCSLTIYSFPCTALLTWFWRPWLEETTPRYLPRRYCCLSTERVS